jgi:BASS family bile acid:Na+ symporter
LILVSAMPGGSLSKVFTYVGLGNAPLSITLSAVSTLATIVTVPATLHLLAAAYVPEHFDMPEGKIVADVLGFLLAPVAAGMLLARVWPAGAPQFARWSVRLGFVVLFAIVIGSLGAGRIRPGDYGLIVPLAIVLFCAVGPQLNMLPFYFLDLPRGDRLAVGIEVTMRNMNLALLLYASLFAAEEQLRDGVLFVVLFYAAAAFGAGVPLALNHRRLWRRERARAAKENR